MNIHIYSLKIKGLCIGDTCEAYFQTLLLYSTFHKIKQVLTHLFVRQDLFIDSSRSFSKSSSSFNENSIRKLKIKKLSQAFTYESLTWYSKRDLNPHSHYWPKDFKSFVSTIPPFEHPQKRAENEARTRDPNLGKVMLYQLSYFRIWF